MSIDSENTQLTLAYDPETGEIFDPDTMVFGEAQANTITLGDGKKITFYRIPVGVRNPDGTVGDLVFPTDRLFSYGVQPNQNDRGIVDGYSVPLCLWSKDGATTSQKGWITGFSGAIACAKAHVVTVKDDIERYDLEVRDLKNFDPIYRKKEKGVIVEGKSPTLYPKLLCSKSNRKEEGPEAAPRILTPFYDEDTDNDIDPKTLINKFCHMTSAVKLESIFCGSKISPQVKMYEATARMASTRSKRLLPKPKARKKVETVDSSNMLSALGHDNSEEDSNDSEDDDGSLDEEEEETPPPKPKKKVVKKRVVKKRVVKKKN
jgi:hypothetical protein